MLEPQPDGGYVVTCPLLPELVTEGETVEEAIRNANNALEALIEGFGTFGRPLPPALRPFTEQEPIWLETAVAVP
jgi:antitoxin HicB